MEVALGHPQLCQVFHPKPHIYVCFCPSLSCFYMRFCALKTRPVLLQPSEEPQLESKHVSTAWTRISHVPHSTCRAPHWGCVEGKMSEDPLVCEFLFFELVRHIVIYAPALKCPNLSGSISSTPPVLSVPASHNTHLVQGLQAWLLPGEKWPGGQGTQSAAKT